ncbi:hypothetical protein DL765_010763 [Monosporascus sp. GIB2]|nr:hypothetical protein DL765_010763 [Monosporascus sp. GIB2]
MTDPVPGFPEGNAAGGRRGGDEGRRFTGLREPGFNLDKVDTEIGNFFDEIEKEKNDYYLVATDVDEKGDLAADGDGEGEVDYGEYGFAGDVSEEGMLKADVADGVLGSGDNRADTGSEG